MLARTLYMYMCTSKRQVEEILHPLLIPATSEPFVRVKLVSKRPLAQTRLKITLPLDLVKYGYLGKTEGYSKKKEKVLEISV